MVSPTGSQVRSKLRPSQRLYKFRSPSHHKGWRLGSQQVRQNCIGVHGRCKTQRGHLQRKPKICSPANPGSSLHLTTTSRNGSGSRSLISLSTYTYNTIILYALRALYAFLTWFIHVCTGVGAQCKQPETGYIKMYDIMRFLLSRISHDCMESSRLHAVCW